MRYCFRCPTLRSRNCKASAGILRGNDRLLNTAHNSFGKERIRSKSIALAAFYRQHCNVAVKVKIVLKFSSHSECEICGYTGNTWNSNRITAEPPTQPGTWCTQHTHRSYVHPDTNTSIFVCSLAPRRMKTTPTIATRVWRSSPLT